MVHCSILCLVVSERDLPRNLFLNGQKRRSVRLNGSSLPIALLVSACCALRVSDGVQVGRLDQMNHSAQRRTTLPLTLPRFDHRHDQTAHTLSPHQSCMSDSHERQHSQRQADNSLRALALQLAQQEQRRTDNQSMHAHSFEQQQQQQQPYGWASASPSASAPSQSPPRNVYEQQYRSSPRPQPSSNAFNQSVGTRSGGRPGGVAGAERTAHRVRDVW